MQGAARLNPAVSGGSPIDVLNVRTSAGIEWAWLVGRFALGVVAAIGVGIFLRDTPAILFLSGLLAGLAIFDLSLALLLLKGRVRAVFLLGFFGDTAFVLTGWAVTTWLLSGTTATNDIYLILFPILVAGVARLGWPLGVIQASLFIGWVAGANLLLLDSSDYVVQQTPLRVLFMAITVGLTVWLVSQIRSERVRTETLWKDSEMLAGISRIISSSPNIDEVYQRFGAALATLIPFDRISVTTIHPEKGEMLTCPR